MFLTAIRQRVVLPPSSRRLSDFVALQLKEARQAVERMGS